jgi:hypothetical protein
LRWGRCSFRCPAILDCQDFTALHHKRWLVLSDRDQVERHPTSEAILCLANLCRVRLVFGIASSIGLLTVVPSIAMLRATEVLPRLGWGKFSATEIASHRDLLTRQIPTFYTLSMTEKHAWK